MHTDFVDELPGRAYYSRPMTFCRTLAVLFLAFLPLARAQDQANDLVPRATTVEASDSFLLHDARNAADGSPDSYWECSGTAAEPCWIEIGWKEPVSISEVVIRRYESRDGTPDLTRLKIEVFASGTW